MCEIPERLKSNGREPDPEFEPKERLYRRFNIRSYQQGKILPTAFKFNPGCSVSRGKYSIPRDVLLPKYNTWGIASFNVEHIPSEITKKYSSQIDTFHLNVEHTPKDLDYSHSDINAYLENKRDSNNSNFIAKKFQLYLWQRQLLTVIKQPGIK